MELSIILNIGFAALVVILAIVHFRIRNRVSALEREFNQLRIAKSLDEMEIKKLKKEKEELQRQNDAFRTQSRYSNR
jgi:uncharacterized membrane protein YciS (DUF1049 family)